MTGGGSKNGLLGRPNFYGDNWGLASLCQRGDASYASVEATLENLATTFSNYVRRRQQGLLDEYGGLTNAFAPSAVGGRVERSSICTRFNWPWLLLPAALILLTASRLAMTSLLRHHDSVHQLPNWKASMLPLLL